MIAPAQHETPPANGRVPAGQATVLIVDDEYGPRESLRYLLKEDYDVLCAESVNEGVSLFRQVRPDLVIMDIRMPGKSGIEGLREIRELDAQVSVIMLTGFGALETAQEALRLGATDYISKPFDTDTMRQLVARHIRRTIIERKRMRLLGELQDVNTRLEHDLEEKEVMASLGQRSAEFAHDLRNPLMIVSGYVELLTSQLDDAQLTLGDQYEQTSQYLDVIGENVRRCCELSQMWNDYRKSSRGQFKAVCLQDLLEDTRKGAEPLANAEGVDIRYEALGEELAILGNRAQLIRALHNVVANAIQAVRDNGGHVYVCVSREKERAVLLVNDTGCGMPPDVRKQIFEPYFTTKAEHEGTGLGMVITKKIIEEHHGEIEVESTEGKGTCVTIRLPVAPAAAPAG
jgi:signal transduction histidine kinase